MAIDVSILLPIHNEARHIKDCLRSIFSQDFPRERFEVLAVEGRSDDGTLALLKRAQERHCNLRVLDNPGKTVTAALNIAITASLGRYLVRCDAHATYAPDYLSSCVAVAEKTGAANVGGHMRALPSRQTLVARAIMLAHYSRFGLGGGRFHDMRFEGVADTVWLGCYRREVFAKIGGYNELLPRSEDIDLNARLKKAGFTCFLSKRVKAFYYCRPDLKSLFTQRLADGIGVIRTIPSNPEALGIRHLIPLVFVVSLAVFVLLAKWPVFRWLLFGELTVYAAASFFFAAQSFFRGRLETGIGADDLCPRYACDWLAPALLPPVFFTLHAAYGIGALYSMITLPFFMKKMRCRARPASDPYRESA